jgi:flagellar basal body-associated protein FliL
MQRRKYIYTHMNNCAIKLSYDEIIIIIIMIIIIIITIINFLFFTGKLNTQKQNPKTAHNLQNNAVYIALIINTKHNNDNNPLNTSNNNSVQFNS